MCTAISVTAGDHYFGRNLDYEHGFGEKIVITPRNLGFSFQNGKKLKRHPAMIGTALPMLNYPLYFDATNEKGLSMAGLNFSGNAVYHKVANGKENIASFELILWVLSQCETVKEAKDLLSCTNITDDAFSKELKPSPLHFIVADKTGAITVEQTKQGMKIYENPTGVLTNNPPFDVQMLGLTNYMNLSPKEPQNALSKALDLTPYSRGMGAIGLPGDLSSASRFIKTCFLNLNAVYNSGEQEIVNQFFHILYSVYQIRGCVRVGDGFEISRYTTCVNCDKGIYYYTTYENSTVNAVDLFSEDLEQEKLIVYELEKHQKVHIQNKKEL